MTQLTLEDALEDHNDTVNIGGRTITNLRFTDDIDGLAGEEEELVNLLNRPDGTARYGMGIRAEKNKIMTNSDSNTITGPTQLTLEDALEDHTDTVNIGGRTRRPHRHS